jgi:dipeptidyl aminopeptidase/acylaminoacyl peptidase
MSPLFSYLRAMCPPFAVSGPAAPSRSPFRSTLVSGTFLIGALTLGGCGESLGSPGTDEAGSSASEPTATGPAGTSDYQALAQADQERYPDALPLDSLLDIGSIVGGEVPRWSPDGSALTYSAGGTIWAADPSGESAPRELGVELGAAGHFLASQEPRYSPDGAWISFISTRSGAQELWLSSTGSNEERQLTRLGARINSYSWSPDGEWIAFAGDRFGTYDIWKVRVEDGSVHRLSTDARYEVFPSWTPDSDEILFVRLDERWVDHDVIRITADGHDPRPVVSDRDFFDYRAGGTFGHPMVSPDGSTVLFRSHRSGWINYWLVPLDGGEPRQVAAEEADQAEASWSPDGTRIAFTSNTNGTHSLKVVAAATGLRAQDSEDTTVRALVSPDEGVVANPQWSPDGDRISFTLQTPTEPADLFVVPVTGGEPVRITDSRPSSEAASSLLEPTKLAYESTDGLTIPAYLYTPPEAENGGGSFPALLWIHGGPTSQFHDTFQQHVQYFTQRGYVVLMPNIRGSSGYGKAFEEANMGCWGRCDLEDVLSGVEFLQNLSYVDADNIGITGTSYGGIMSMAAPTFAPGVFQAAAPIAGYADYPHFMEEQELRHLKLLEYELGPLEENEELYRHLSPIYFVEDITTPFLVIQGEGFFPESEASRHFVEELERYYKPFRYRVYSNENYYVRGRENRRRMLLDMLDFFDTKLKDHGIVSFAPEPLTP